MYENTKKLFVGFKSELLIFEEEIKTTMSKLDEVVISTYNNLNPKINDIGKYLNREIANYKKTTSALKIQVNCLEQENSDIGNLIDEYVKRAEKIRNIIHG